MTCHIELGEKRSAVLLKDCRGQAVILVVLLTLLIFMLGTAAFALSVSLRKNTAREVIHKQAYYIAAAGVAGVLAQAKPDRQWAAQMVVDSPLEMVPQMIPAAYAGGTLASVKVTRVSGDDLLLNVESRSSYRGGRCLLRVRVRLDRPLDFSHQIWTTVTPDLQPFPIFDLTPYSREADFYYSGNQNWSGSLSCSGLHYVAGDLAINGSYSGRGIVIVDGLLDISGNLVALNEQQDCLVLLCRHDLNVPPGARLEALCYTPATFRLGDGAIFQGSLIAGNLVSGSAAGLEYLPDLVANAPQELLSSVSILSWSEIGGNW